jgi:hypothetical protein
LRIGSATGARRRREVTGDSGRNNAGSSGATAAEERATMQEGEAEGRTLSTNASANEGGGMTAKTKGGKGTTRVGTETEEAPTAQEITNVPDAIHS